MWTRRELKERAKEALRRNYWKIVLIAALTMLLGGGVGSTGVGIGSRDVDPQQIIEQSGVISEDAGDVYEEAYDEDDRDVDDDEAGREYDAVQTESAQDKIYGGIAGYSGMFAAVVIGIVIFLVIFLVTFILIFAVDVFLFNPFSVGVSRFMLKSIDGRAEVREIAYGFDHSYKNVVKTLFHRDLQILLWALLFIIPGIYKKYQYRMVPYIMAEHSDMEYTSVLQMSKDMMNGHKWRAFVLDLSFILWHILGTITCGIAEIFYVQPYQQLTGAALYRRLCQTDGSRNMI